MKFGTRVRVFPFRPAAVLRATGEDALTFLQGQFTQDLKPCADGRVAYGLWLNQKGKVLADSFVWKDAADVWWLVSYFSPAAIIRERLESYIIADDVTLEDETENWEGFTLVGDEAATWLAQTGVSLPGENAVSIGSAGMLWRGRRGVDAWEWLRPRAHGALDLGAAEIGDAEELERARITAAVPAIPRDIGPSDLPQEAGLEVSAISFTKGCYLGQEVMARLHAMGQVRRRLLPVVAAIGVEMPTTLPADVFSGEKRIGELRSACADSSGEGWRGLAMLSTLGLPADATLSLVAGGPTALTLGSAPQ
jgi:folate-binding protein YgfZ